MTTSSRIEGPLTASFVEAGAQLHVELTNTTAQPLKCVETLTVFLKDEETPGGGPSRAHIKFETINYLRPKETVVLAHRTWIDGKPADLKHDKLARLKIVAGSIRPYVLDISWEDVEGKSQYQRILVGR